MHAPSAECAAYRTRLIDNMFAVQVCMAAAGSPSWSTGSQLLAGVGELPTKYKVSKH